MSNDPLSYGLLLKHFWFKFFLIALLSSLGSAPKASEPESENLQRNQTFGQRVMGNMMDNIFLRSFASKPKIQSEDVSTPSSPLKVKLFCMYFFMKH